MVNESCLGFDPKFLELKEEVHVRKREEGDIERREVHVHERILNFYCTYACLFLLFSPYLLFPSPPSPSYRILLIQLISVYSQ